MKKQDVVIMDQSQKSLDRERAVLQQAQEALKLKETATTEAFTRHQPRRIYARPSDRCKFGYGG
jgi:hypothetical protein